jgi:membrane associated rhomboid family serine protease
MNLTSWINDATQALTAMRQTVPFVLGWMAVVWGFSILNFITKNKLSILGIYPRRAAGLIGIPFSPFLHGDFNHLFFNSIPLFILANFVLLSGKTLFYEVSALIIVISGLLTWLFARPGFHIGASSLIMGYWSYVLTLAIYEQSAGAIIVGVVTLYYLGGLFFSLFPSEVKVSWEGHLFGVIAGIGAVFIVEYNLFW